MGSIRHQNMAGVTATSTTKPIFWPFSPAEFGFKNGLSIPCKIEEI
jgi:hypothetical protein